MDEIIILGHHSRYIYSKLVHLFAKSLLINAFFDFFFLKKKYKTLCKDAKPISIFLMLQEHKDR